MLKYVIIGGGAAALSCIEGIRSIDKTGEITLVSKETYPFYGRPLISYLLEGKTTMENVLAYRPADYETTHGVRALRGETVTAIDATSAVAIPPSLFMLIRSPDWCLCQKP